MKNIQTPIKSNIGNHDKRTPNNEGILSSTGDAIILTFFSESLPTKSGS